MPRKQVSSREAPGGVDRDEARLVEKAQTGDPDGVRAAFEALVGRYGSCLLDHLRWRGLTRAEADDVASETWVRALTAISHFQHQGVGLFAWLKGIASNVRRERFRQRYVTSPDKAPATFDDDRTRDIERPAAIDTIASREFVAAVERVLPEAPQEYQEIIEACFLANYDTDEIVAVLGWSKSKVYTTKHRARRWLKERLQHEYGPSWNDDWKAD